VPFFRKLVAEGADHLPITDPRMTRFWITLSQGVDFVLSSLEIMHGGEIFVPKIPSTKITDIARIMGPELPTKVIGIRPGEKLHETMITEDDSRMTISFPDRYVIQPALSFWSGENHPGNEPVPEGFRYASNINDEWLDDAGLTKLLREATA
jgi:UDP-N-acetylglucosamine 4,6-dehydratase